MKIGRGEGAAARRSRAADLAAGETERRRAVEAELHERDRQLRAILAGIGDAVIVADAEDRVSFMSVAAEALTGWPEAQARGRPVNEVFRRADRGVLLDRSGERVRIEESRTHLEDDGGGRVLVFREVAEHEHADRERLLREERAARLFAERLVARVAQLQALTSALSWSPRLADVVDAALAHGPPALGAVSALLYLRASGTASLDLAGHAGLLESTIDAIRTLHADEDQAAATAAQTGLAEWIEGPEELAARSRVAPALLTAGICSAAVVPLNVDGRTLGVMFMGFPGRRRLTAEERSFALTAADQCAQALDRALAHARAERAADRTARLQEVTAAFSEARTPADVAAVVVTQGCAALDAPRGLVGVLADDAESVEVLQTFGYPDDDAASWAPLSMSEPTPLTDAVRWGTPVILESAAAALARYPALPDRLLGAGEAYALVAVPLAMRGRVLGVMGLSFDMARSFDEDDRTFMLALARQCAQALDRARLYEAAARARAAAEAASRAKDDFLSTLSHELRTPLTAILGWADILRTRRPDGGALGRPLEIIERNAKALVQLIEDMLDVSRIVAGKLRLEPRTVDPAAVVRAAVDVMRPAAEQKRVEIDPVLDEGVGTLTADPVRLQQIAWNLLSNAVKFSPKGGRIEVRLSQVAGAVRLRVTDAGAGIAATFLPHVFERFRQADGSSTRASGGLGLGLAIVKHLVELHEGVITAESAGLGLGATFTVTFPERPRLSTSPGATWTADPVTPMIRRLDGVRVVIVDDEPDARDLVATILQGQGAAVTVATSALEAVCAVKFERPDVFVSDIGMPDEDGYTLLEKVRSLATPQERTVPALALTAYAGVEDARMAALAGFQRHLPKPVTPAVLIDAVARLAGRAG